jgi:hypothetical protein
MNNLHGLLTLRLLQQIELREAGYVFCNTIVIRLNENAGVRKMCKIMARQKKTT